MPADVGTCICGAPVSVPSAERALPRVTARGAVGNGFRQLGRLRVGSRPYWVMGLFDLVTGNLSKAFEKIRDSPHSLVARRAMLDVFASFEDPDGNFVEQFQSRGFDARVLELCLHAGFSELGYRVHRPKAPDFLIERGGHRIAVEATTTNPSASGVMAQHSRPLHEHSRDDRWNYLHNDWAIRIGGPLTAKLDKHYWQKSECAGLPLVLAIEAFHEPMALSLSHTMVAAYLYGIQATSRQIDAGRMVLEPTVLTAHTVGTKSIPSGFFNLPDAENISAVIFTNSATSAKFTRMGWRTHGAAATTMAARVGVMWNPDPDIRYATWFAYDLREPPFQERWTDGMVVIHNPNALVPLPAKAFDGLTQIYAPLDHDFVERHVFSSTTILNAALSSAFHPIEVPCIPRYEGRAMAGIPLPEIVTSDYWFADRERQFLGLVTQDTEEPNEWRSWNLARADDGRHYPIEGASRLFSFDQEAVNVMQERIAFLAFRSRNSTDCATWLPGLFPRTVAEFAAPRKAEADPL